MLILVTGGGGFLGSHVVQRLLARGHRVRSFARGHYPQLEALAVSAFRGDLALGGEPLARALEGVEAVVHCAAKAGVHGPAADFERANHLGTQNLLHAARQAGVRSFVHTSSPSVCFDGTDHVWAGPELPYATRFLAPYPASKARAEQAVLAAHDPQGMCTVALRPHLIFGPGDPHLIPRLLDRARAGKLVQVGAGKNEVSLTFVANAAHAHVLAVEQLGPMCPAAGRAYFVGQTEPVLLWTWIGELLAALGLPPVRRRLPAQVAYGLGAALEAAYRVLGCKNEPPLSRFVAQQLAKSHSYDMGPLERDLGYREEVPLAEATRATIAALLDRRAETSRR